MKSLKEFTTVLGVQLECARHPGFQLYCRIETVKGHDKIHITVEPCERCGDVAFEQGVAYGP